MPKTKRIDDFYVKVDTWITERGISYKDFDDKEQSLIYKREISDQLDISLKQVHHTLRRILRDKFGPEERQCKFRGPISEYLTHNNITIDEKTDLNVLSKNISKTVGCHPDTVWYHLDEAYKDSIRERELSRIRTGNGSNGNNGCNSKPEIKTLDFILNDNRMYSRDAAIEGQCFEDMVRYMLSKIGTNGMGITEPRSMKIEGNVVIIDFGLWNFYPTFLRGADKEKWVIAAGENERIFIDTKLRFDSEGVEKTITEYLHDKSPINTLLILHAGTKEGETRTFTNDKKVAYIGIKKLYKLFENEISPELMHKLDVFVDYVDSKNGYDSVEHNGVSNGAKKESVWNKLEEMIANETHEPSYEQIIKSRTRLIKMLRGIFKSEVGKSMINVIESKKDPDEFYEAYKYFTGDYLQEAQTLGEDIGNLNAHKIFEGFDPILLYHPKIILYGELTISTANENPGKCKEIMKEWLPHALKQGNQLTPEEKEKNLDKLLEAAKKGIILSKRSTYYALNIEDSKEETEYNISQVRKQFKAILKSIKFQKSKNHKEGIKLLKRYVNDYLDYTCKHGYFPDSVITSIQEKEKWELEAILDVCRSFDGFVDGKIGFKRNVNDALVNMGFIGPEEYKPIIDVIETFAEKRIKNIEKRLGETASRFFERQQNGHMKIYNKYNDLAEINQANLEEAIVGKKSPERSVKCKLDSVLLATNVYLAVKKYVKEFGRPEGEELESLAKATGIELDFLTAYINDLYINNEAETAAA